ncbi:biogenesis of lysosome-related organelles complex 1 subunit 4 isoform X2 [Schistocerca piceifrons]|uniref:biogenesis of lysosome-related organelles complex 1 subunit 4 isoform X2 n=1 Tax=Schistocerca piceifrons TaxID=274613 RepID=UPI001F5FEB9D|nr:biogenesis of lysosome-related organelles complex 1 subunit 4 isoform X2 [Schistocerca piceifrons]
MITDLADDYASYFKLDVNKEISPVMETIEDMLTRLEEFESLMDMVRTDVTQSAVATVPDIVACKSELRTLCDRIDCLEALVTRVRRDLDTVESQLDTAEATVGGEGVIRNMLKPLFFKNMNIILQVKSRNQNLSVYMVTEAKKGRLKDGWNISKGCTSETNLKTVLQKWKRS